ncbi:winged helix-turn-helix transcriptional regulator [Paenibacillus lycopersici]|uniref:Winged helix-turn-helix transcriptional regulator n=1 Tax=Paenibacillus lycopersici TaxID=2704462 RepID=A0A6C0FZE0_9BACL|nr:MarR family winged helix-turn-helix transcriptional regulator [Paenibacillus lycopersici]QHT60594.1 winged helix-turn-helix transcriptional regulator [Paenibacillus lycopersici]
MDRADFIRESIDYMHRFMMKSLQKHAEQHGITVPQTRVIAEVLTKQSMTIKQLTQNLKMTQSTVSDIVERLTVRGILAKTPDPKDKRSVIVTLTDKTLKDIKGRTPEPLNAYIRDVLSLLNPQEQAIVEDGIRLLVTAIREKTQNDGAHSDEYFDILFLSNGGQK